MLNGCVTDEVPAARVVLWSGGEKRPAEGAEGAQFDARLHVEWLGEGFAGATAAFTLRMTPGVRTFVGVDGESAEVHIFRYVRWDGVEGFMAYCASCGHVVMACREELMDCCAWACPGCSSPVCGERCSGWHNWGACLDCPSGVPVGTGQASYMSENVGPVGSRACDRDQTLHNHPSKSGPSYDAVASDLGSGVTPAAGGPEDGTLAAAPPVGPIAPSQGSVVDVAEKSG